MIYQYVYSSRAGSDFTSVMLENILEKARIHNATLGITGILLFSDGYFVQLLEGRKRAVESLLSKIKNDPQHLGFEPLLEQEADAPIFGNWSMAYVALTPEKIKQYGGSMGINDARELIALLRRPGNSLSETFSVVLKDLLQGL